MKQCRLLTLTVGEQIGLGPGTEEDCNLSELPAERVDLANHCIFPCICLSWKEWNLSHDPNGDLHFFSLEDGGG